MKTLVDLLVSSTQRFSGAPALTMKMGYRTTTFTYQQVYELACQTALFLKQQGIEKGDTVLVCAPNSPYWAIVYWACVLRGALIVPLNIQSSEKVIQSITLQTEARILFHHQFFKYELPDTVVMHRLEFLGELVADIDPKDFTVPQVDENDLMQIMYTSGTTGEPKGVMHTHKNILANIRSLTKVIPLKTKNERLLSILPLSHIFEQTIGFFLPYCFGSHIIYAHAHSAIRSLLRNYKITILVAVPEFLHLVVSRLETQLEKIGKLSTFEKMLSYAKKVGSKVFSRLLFLKLHRSFGGKLKLIASGGAPLDPELEATWRALGFDIVQGYGLTETSPVVTCNTLSYHKLGSVGKVLEGVQVRFNENQEIEVKGDNVFQGYYKNEQRTAQVFTDDGWFKTGDIGELDEQGFLFLKGREKYMILGAGGQNVFPEDVELELNKQPGVLDSCVIGLETRRGAVKVHAVLLMDSEVETTPEKVVVDANEHLASYQAVNGWSVWDGDDFPRTPTKKIKKEEVIKWVASHQSATSADELPQTSKLAKILSTITGTDASLIKPSTKIQYLNVDSLTRVELVARIEEDFGVLLDEAQLTNQTTVDQLEEMIKNYEPSKEEKLLKTWPLTLWARIARTFGQYLLFLYARLFVRLKVKGKHNLKGLKGPVIFMPNHLSYVDAILVTWALPLSWRWRISFAAAQDMLYEEYKHLVPAAELLMNAFSFPRHEKENIKSGLDRMGQMLDNNFSVVLFPEGKISQDTKLQQLKLGAGLVGVEMDCHIVPIKIVDIEKIFPYGSDKAVKKGEATVIIGKPFKLNKMDSYEDATAQIEREMKNVK